jgi:hypothetical protein
MRDVDGNETDPKGNTVVRWCLSSNSSAMEQGDILRNSAPLPAAMLDIFSCYFQMSHSFVLSPTEDWCQDFAG